MWTFVKGKTLQFNLLMFFFKFGNFSDCKSSIHATYSYSLYCTVVLYQLKYMYCNLHVKNTTVINGNSLEQYFYCKYLVIQLVNSQRKYFIKESISYSYKILKFEMYWFKAFSLCSYVQLWKNNRCKQTVIDVWQKLTVDLCIQSVTSWNDEPNWPSF